nr:DUF2169 domain-containing protein [Proteus mirabilis]
MDLVIGNIIVIGHWVKLSLFLLYRLFMKRLLGKNSHQEVNDKNPIGVGWYDSHDMDKTRQYPAPQIYYPLKEHILSVDKPWEVAGYGQYNRWWQQRVQFAGTYNDEWLNNIKPIIRQILILLFYEYSSRSTAKRFFCW